MTNRNLVQTLVVGFMAVLVGIAAGALLLPDDGSPGRCQDAGGYIEKANKTTLCVSPDGRVLEVHR